MKPNTISNTQAVSELQVTFKQIGIARFVGRINSGIIPPDEGYAVVETFVEKAKERPFLSRVTKFVLGSNDSYTQR